MARIPSILIPGKNLICMEDCWLCSDPIFYRAIYLIRAFDDNTKKTFMASLEIPVCEGHAKGISFEIVKQLKPNVGQLIII